MTAFTLVEPLTGFGGHGFGLNMTAMRTGQRGLEDWSVCHTPIVPKSRRLWDGESEGLFVSFDLINIPPLLGGFFWG